MCAGRGILTKGVGAQAPRRCPGSDARALFVGGPVPFRKWSKLVESGRVFESGRNRSPVPARLPTDGGKPRFSSPIIAKHRHESLRKVREGYAKAGRSHPRPPSSSSSSSPSAGGSARPGGPRGGSAKRRRPRIPTRSPPISTSPPFAPRPASRSARGWDRSAAPSPAPPSTSRPARRRFAWRRAKAEEAAAAASRARSSSPAPVPASSG